jgi:hypothetical protein
VFEIFWELFCIFTINELGHVVFLEQITLRIRSYLRLLNLKLLLKEAVHVIYWYLFNAMLNYLISLGNYMQIANKWTYMVAVKFQLNALRKIWF